ncbi:bifunctional endo-1,4-beta-xylanase XylA-like [Thrips palmi]|uniref:Bifunctional endo-1,4-beta-xylanase XylA-like n=1 Tax=Thrips palmi TaxID=161013 RepID=A0A6P8YL28_THRPL|nr:bifunctional endo-1,4-beta-xylanase XylA-like [Thrips palmi]
MDRKLLVVTIVLACVASCLARPKWGDAPRHGEVGQGLGQGQGQGPQRGSGSHGLTWTAWTSDDSKSGSSWNSGSNHNSNDPWNSDSSYGHTNAWNSGSNQNSGNHHGQTNGNTNAWNSGSHHGQTNANAWNSDSNQNSGNHQGQTNANAWNSGSPYGQNGGSTNAWNSHGNQNSGSSFSKNGASSQGSTNAWNSGVNQGHNSGSTLDSSRHHYDDQDQVDQVGGDSTWDSSSGSGRNRWSARSQPASQARQVGVVVGRSTGGSSAASTHGQDADSYGQESQWQWSDGSAGSTAQQQQHPAGRPRQGAAVASPRPDRHHDQEDDFYGRREY